MKNISQNIVAMIASATAEQPSSAQSSTVSTGERKHGAIRPPLRHAQRRRNRCPDTRSGGARPSLARNSGSTVARRSRLTLMVAGQNLHREQPAPLPFMQHHRHNCPCHPTGTQASACGLRSCRSVRDSLRGYPARCVLRSLRNSVVRGAPWNSGMIFVGIVQHARPYAEERIAGKRDMGGLALRGLRQRTNNARTERNPNMRQQNMNRRLDCHGTYAERGGAC